MIRLEKRLSRAEQRDIILTSSYYQSGEEFTRIVIAPLIGLTMEGAAGVLTAMHNDGLLGRRQSKIGCKTYITYCKPVTKLLRRRWRTETDGRIGIQKSVTTPLLMR